MDLASRFIDHVIRKNLFSKKDRLLVAVSGGIDSVVLCELCRQAGFDFSIVHCNFHLREEESDRDENFVSVLSEKYRVQFHLRQFDTSSFAEEQGLSVQEAARKLRYDWFAELVTAEKEKTSVPVYLLTAHHADDNAETLAMHFFRGTGLHGLTGIPAINSYIRRPLLPFPKQELIDFATANGLQYVDDSSNESSRYTRNYFRNEILPAVSKVYPEVLSNLADNAARFTEIENLYKQSVDLIRKKLLKKKGEEIHIPIRQLLGYNNRALVYEIISDFGFQEKQVAEVYKLAESDSGKYIVSPDGTFRIIRHRLWFIITPLAGRGSEYFIVEEDQATLLFPAGKLVVEIIPAAGFKIPDSGSIACLDRKHVKFPFLLRKWKQGDYFYPLGMKKKKKLARFFIDQKLSQTEKENTWVLESEKRIVWVVGYRIDERFKLTGSTKQIYKIALERK
jgi:tRNA(Ile)-lysidine synthase